jgi:Zn finger protein HypA/HybF involved in hydrogenase expression
MPIQSGEKARKTGEFKCEKCRNYVFVVSGHQIPNCPNCGHNTFDPNITESE